MRHSLTFLVLMLSVAAFGCGDEPKLDIEIEPAGENCALGGIKITDGDAVHYSCETAAIREAAGENCAAGGIKVIGADGDYYICENTSHFEFEQVPAGSAEHSCLGAAMKITLQGETNEVKYVCLAGDTIHDAFRRVLDNLLINFFDRVPEHIEACITTDWQREDFDWAYREFQAMIPFLTSCTFDILTIVGPPPANSIVERQFLCQARGDEVRAECHEAAYAAVKSTGSEADLCDIGKYEEIFLPCLGEHNLELTELCSMGEGAEPSEEELMWLTRFEFAIERTSCSNIFF